VLTFPGETGGVALGRPGAVKDLLVDPPLPAPQARSCKGRGLKRRRLEAALLSPSSDCTACIWEASGLDRDVAEAEAAFLALGMVGEGRSLCRPPALLPGEEDRALLVLAMLPPAARAGAGELLTELLLAFRAELAELVLRACNELR